MDVNDLFTSEEIEECYRSPAAKRKKIPHDQEDLSHQIGMWWESVLYDRDQLYDPETHTAYELPRFGYGTKLRGLTEAEVQADPEAAFKKMALAVIGVMYRSVFPDG